MTERTIKMLEWLDPSARPRFELFLNNLDNAIGDDRYIVYEGRRSIRTQEAYYAQGRQSLDEVNALRRTAGLYLLRSERENYRITWTLASKHLEGLAMDVLPMDGAGNPTWDLAHYQQIFADIRDCGRAAGLVCGADWPDPKKDWPHYEVK